MSEYWGTYNFKDHVSNDSLKEFEIELLSETGPLDFTGATLTWNFRPKANPNQRVYSMTTDNGKLELSDPSNGKFVVKEQIIPLAPGVYVHDLTVVLSNGFTRRRLVGEWVIKPNY